MRFLRMAALAACVGCSEITAAEALDVRVERDGAELIITNGRDAPIYYFAVGESLAAVIDWIPCVTEPGCPSVPAQSVRRIPGGAYAPADEAILFYWWHAEPGPDGPVPGSVRMLRID